MLLYANFVPSSDLHNFLYVLAYFSTIYYFVIYCNCNYFNKDTTVWDSIFCNNTGWFIQNYIKTFFKIFCNWKYLFFFIKLLMAFKGNSLCFYFHFRNNLSLSSSTVLYRFLDSRHLDLIIDNKWWRRLKYFVICCFHSW